MKIFKKVRSGYDRKLYFLGMNIFSYKSKTNVTPKSASQDKTRLFDRVIEEFDGNGTSSEKKQDSPRLIVSLTSFPARMYDIHYCLYSILTQSHKPDEIVLWLGEDKFPNKEKDLPEKVLNFRKNGLTIKWCKDIRSFTKLIPALKEYPNDIIITLDDDIFYPKDTIKNLYKAYIAAPQHIHCNRVRNIAFSDNGEIAPYNDWKIGIKNAPSYANFFTGVGGVLYFPHALDKEVFNEDAFMTLAPLADDIWFWAMAVKNKVKISVVKKDFTYLDVNPQRANGVTSEPTLSAINCLQNKNDEQIKNVLQRYPELRQTLMEYIS